MGSNESNNVLGYPPTTDKQASKGKQWEAMGSNAEQWEAMEATAFGRPTANRRARNGKQWEATESNGGSNNVLGDPHFTKLS